MSMKNNNGFFLIDKAKDYTSRDVDSLLKRKFNLEKAGHLGTLDPFATGLLFVAFNDATKLLDLIDDSFKTYTASLKLGIETDTLDYTGNIIKKENVKDYSLNEIEDVLNSFLGKSKQITPQYSAKHINGVKAYKLARRGEDFKAPEISIDIKEINLIAYQNSEIIFNVTVSKGTYIRALGRDIATKLNTCSHLTSLRRTNISNFSVENAKKIEDITLNDAISIVDMFPSIKIYNANNDRINALNGHKLKIDQDDEYLFVAVDNRILGLYKKEDEFYKSYRGFKRLDN